MNDIIFWVIVIVIHEFGHWIGFKLFGLTGKLKFIGIGVGIYNKDGNNLKISQSFIVYSLGILFGLIPVLLINPTIPYYFLYYTICTMDMAVLFTYSTQKNWNIKVKDIQEISFKDD